LWCSLHLAVVYEPASSSTEIFTIDFSSEDPWSAFVSMVEIEGNREFYIFRGTELVTKCTNDDISLWDIHAPGHAVKLHNPAHLEVLHFYLLSLTYVLILQIRQPEKCQAVVLQDKFVIIIRLTTFEIYALPSHPRSESATGKGITIYPAAQHKWQWRTDTVCVAEPPPVLISQYQNSRRRPVNVLIRFGSMFPWPSE
jgi:hypothetical protein